MSFHKYSEKPGAFEAACQAEASALQDMLNSPRGRRLLRDAGGLLTCVGPKTGAVFYLSAWRATWGPDSQAATHAKEAAWHYLDGVLARRSWNELREAVSRTFGRR